MKTYTPVVRPPSRPAGPPVSAHPVPKHSPRADIQGLRALAVTMVVLSHAGVGPVAGGYAGVDVFFVVSGFLITSQLLRELSATGRMSVGGFYARRALRLLPAATVVIVVTLAGSWLFLSKVRFQEYVLDAVGSALYVLNLRLAVDGTDYLAEGSPPSPFQHFWSLAVEEQFYLVWPLLLLATWRLSRRRRTTAVVLGLLCGVSLGMSVWAMDGPASWAYFGSHTRFWELGAGALLALSAARLGRLPVPAAAVLSWAGLASVLLSAVLFDDGTAFPGYYALLPVLGTVLVLAGGCVPGPYGAGRLLGLRPAVLLGGLSYSWYLWHWPLLVIGPGVLDGPTGVRTALLLAVLALLPAWATARLVENPVRFHPALRGRHGRALALGACLSALAAVTALTASLFPPAVGSGRAAPVPARELADAPDPAARLRELLESSGDSLPGNLTPGLTSVKASEAKVYADGCHVGYESVSTPPCVYGDPASDQVVVLFGDSHAAQWFPALDRLASVHHWKLVSLTKASCKPAEVTTVHSGAPYTSCDIWRHRVLARIGAVHPALVVVSSSEAGDATRPAADPVRQWAEGFGETFGAIRRSGAGVAVLLDTPWPRADAVDCAASHPMDLRRCANSLPEAIEDPGRRKAVRDAARSSGAAVIDPAPWLCTDAGGCPVAVGNTLVYRDDSHVAEAYAAALAPLLDERLTALRVAPGARTAGRTPVR
ncbi:acyltransferase family protein [Streptomyces sp. NPDC059166]|uniref:acyltransferase family protein n=1 Tax=Streptomyces sp. NPDC059166 TaxID=3346752 RepID=UPI0036847FFD